MIFSLTGESISRGADHRWFYRSEVPFYHSFSFNAISIKSDEVTKKDYVVVP
nr:MAG TPA: hypothetical protein [Caudoviricetes sp.]